MTSKSAHMVAKSRFEHEVQRSRGLFASSISQHHSFTKTINAIRSSEKKFERQLEQVHSTDWTVVESLFVLNRLLTAFVTKDPHGRDDDTLIKEWSQIEAMVESLSDI